MRSSIRTMASLSSDHTPSTRNSRKARKVSVLAGVTAAALALTACGGGGDTEKPAADGSETPRRKLPKKRPAHPFVTKMPISSSGQTTSALTS